MKKKVITVTTYDYEAQPSFQHCQESCLVIFYTLKSSTLLLYCYFLQISDYGLHIILFSVLVDGLTLYFICKLNSDGRKFSQSLAVDFQILSLP